MKKQFNIQSCAEWIAGFLQYCCDSRDEIVMVLEKVLEAFDVRAK